MTNKTIERDIFKELAVQLLRAKGYKAELKEAIDANYNVRKEVIQIQLLVEDEFVTAAQLNVNKIYDEANTLDEAFNLIFTATEESLKQLDRLKEINKEIERLDRCSFDELKNHLFVELMPIEGNEDFLKDKVYENVADNIAIVVKVLGPAISGSNGSLVAYVTKSALAANNVTNELFMRYAKMSAANLFPAAIESFSERVPDCPVEAFIVSTTDGKNAAPLFYPGVMEGLYYRYGEFYVLLSNKNEALIIPCHADNKPLDIMLGMTLHAAVESGRETFKENNTEFLLLSDKVYRYDGHALKIV